MMNLFIQTISITGYAVETTGVVLIVVGAIRASVRAIGQLSEENRDEMFQRFRREISRSMLVGLEFLVAGDIIRTVIVAHSMTDILGLGMLVLIRTILVFTIHLELEGRWPWQPAPEQVQMAKNDRE
jgi:uncharacterized membrane protein